MDGPSQISRGADYSVTEHRHRFATWAAARAAALRLERGTTSVLAAALEQCGVVTVVRGPESSWPASAADFDAAHTKWCVGVVDALRRLGVAGATYGRAAKLVAIYLKTMIVVGGREATAFARVMHPPIDEILLKSLARDHRFSKPARRSWATTAWTKLDQPSYGALIASLRDERLDEPAFWEIERYWRPSRDRASDQPAGTGV